MVAQSDVSVTPQPVSRAGAIAALGLAAALLVTPLMYLLLGKAGAATLGSLTAIPLSERLVSPTSELGMQIGVEYQLRAALSGCGIASAVDFDGSFWMPEDHPSSAWLAAYSGSILMFDANHAVLNNGKGLSLTLTRSNALRIVPDCYGALTLF